MKNRKSREQSYVVFTEEMKATHTILVPNMLPMHFKIIAKVMEKVGYRVEVLETQGAHIAETGLKYVHNDTCYPAILVIGQFMDALQSGAYDPDRVALILFQTGGGSTSPRVRLCPSDASSIPPRVRFCSSEG